MISKARRKQAVWRGKRFLFARLRGRTTWRGTHQFIGVDYGPGESFPVFSSFWFEEPKPK